VKRVISGAPKTWPPQPRLRSRLEVTEADAAANEAPKQLMAAWQQGWFTWGKNTSNDEMIIVDMI